MSENYIPTSGYVFIKEKTAEKAAGEAKTLILASKESPFAEVVVVATSNEVLTAKGVMSITLPYSAGATLLVPRTAIQKAYIEGEDLLMVRAEDVRAYKN